MSLELIASPKHTYRDAGISVLGRINYLEPGAEKPYARYTDDPGGKSETNATYVPRNVTINNARRVAEPSSLDVQGFQLVRHCSGVRDFRDEHETLALGRTEAAQLVKQTTGAKRVLVFDHTLRQRIPASPRQPSIRVHNDYTETSAPARVRELLGSDADELLKKRVAFINVWRPILHPADDSPLTLADARTVASADFIPADVIYEDRIGEIYAVAHSPAHRWYYYPSMQLDEAVLLKCYDSNRAGARFVAHTSFDNPDTPANAPPRASIEFRSIAFYG